jgi:hypothetical protein
MLVVSSTTLAADTLYTKQPGKEISKLEAMKILLTSDNKETVYKCQAQKLSDKGTMKNK